MGNFARIAIKELQEIAYECEREIYAISEDYLDGQFPEKVFVEIQKLTAKINLCYDLISDLMEEE